MVERVPAEGADDFARLMDRAYAWPAEWREAAMAEARGAFRPGALHFVVSCDGGPAGTGSINVHDGIAWLRGGAVLARWRGRGCHAALVQHRLHVADTLGCTLVMGGADYGSGSFRNQQRAGLQLAYVESGWSRR